MSNKILKSELRSLLNRLSSKEDFIIFTYPKTDNFIQFAWENDNELLVDIPTKSLEVKHPSKSLINSKIDNLEDSGVNSLQKLCSIEEAINLIKLFFEDICNLPKNYGLEISLYCNNQDSELILGGNNSNEIDFLACDFILETINIVSAKNIDKAKEKYSLLYLDLETVLVDDVEEKNNDSMFWEDFVYKTKNKNEILENLKETFDNEIGSELFDFYKEDKLKFNNLSDKTKKAIALRDLNRAIEDDTIIFKPYFQVNKLK